MKQRFSGTIDHFDHAHLHDVHLLRHRHLSDIANVQATINV